MAATVLGPESGEEPDWTYGLPGARLANALREWQVTELPGDYYQMLNASDGDIVTLFKAFGIDVPAKMYTRKRDLRIFNWKLVTMRAALSNRVSPSSFTSMSTLILSAPDIFRKVVLV